MEAEKPTFLNRKQLNFEHGNTFSLIVDLITSNTVPVDVRGYTKSGFFTRRIQPTASDAIQTFTLLVDDIPTMLSVFHPTTGFDPTVSHVTVHLAIGQDRIGLLAQGSIGPTWGISWPHQHPFVPEQADGHIVEVAGTLPAAGAEISNTVPDNESWEILGIQIRLVADANAADRTVRLNFITGNNFIVRRVAGTTQQANETQRYHFVPGGTSAVVTADQEQEVALPQRIILPPSSQITTTTTNRQAGDAFTDIIYMIRKRYIGQIAEPLV